MKKVLGLVIILIGVIIFISAIRTAFDGFPKLLQIKDAYSMGSAIGYMVMSFLFLLLSIWIIEKGGKMIKKPKRSIEEKIDELE